VKLNLIEDWPAELATAVRAVEKALKARDDIKLPAGDINLKLVDDDQIAALNKQYSGNAYATDVLTFAYRQDDPHSPTVADIAISHEMAQRQALSVGTSLANEMALLALHGILHALGLDHQDADGRVAMERLQAEVMGAAGFKYREFEWTQS
jgi:probable rRNA maturation factor